MVSAGGVQHDLCGGFPSEEAAEEYAARHGWRYLDENRFEWSLDIKQDYEPIKTGRSHRHNRER